jgi:hypothetical protein
MFKDLSSLSSVAQAENARNLRNIGENSRRAIKKFQECHEIEQHPSINRLHDRLTENILKSNFKILITPDLSSTDLYR